jgi:hypothetical protein
MRARLSYANVMATIAVFLALGGTSVAAVQLARNSVGAKQIKRDAVRAAELRAGAVRSAEVRDGALTGADVRDGSLTAADLAAGLLGAGPQGPPGPAGATGPQGPAGPAATDEERPYGRARQTSAQTLATYPERVRLDDAPLTAGVTFDDANDQLVIETAGVYLLTGEMLWSPDTGPRYMTLDSSTQNELTSDSRDTASFAETGQSVTTVRRLAAGEAIFLRAGTNGASTTTAAAASRDARAQLAVAWLGP